MSKAQNSGLSYNILFHSSGIIKDKETAQQLELAFDISLFRTKVIFVVHFIPLALSVITKIVITDTLEVFALFASKRQRVCVYVCV